MALPDASAAGGPTESRTETFAHHAEAPLPRSSVAVRPSVESDAVAVCGVFAASSAFDTVIALPVPPTVRVAAFIASVNATVIFPVARSNVAPTAAGALQSTRKSAAASGPAEPPESTTAAWTACQPLPESGIVTAKRPAASALPVNDRLPSRTRTAAFGAAVPATTTCAAQRTAGSASRTGGAPVPTEATVNVTSFGAARACPARSEIPAPARNLYASPRTIAAPGAKATALPATVNVPTAFSPVATRVSVSPSAPGSDEGRIASLKRTSGISFASTCFAPSAGCMSTTVGAVTSLKRRRLSFAYAPAGSSTRAMTPNGPSATGTVTCAVKLACRRPSASGASHVRPSRPPPLIETIAPSFAQASPAAVKEGGEVSLKRVPSTGRARTSAGAVGSQMTLTVAAPTWPSVSVAVAITLCGEPGEDVASGTPDAWNAPVSASTVAVTEPAPVETTTEARFGSFVRSTRPDTSTAAAPVPGLPTCAPSGGDVIVTFGAAESRKTTTRSSPVRPAASTALAARTFGPSTSGRGPAANVPDEAGALTPFTVTAAAESEIVPLTATVAPFWRAPPAGRVMRTTGPAPSGRRVIFRFVVETVPARSVQATASVLSPTAARGTSPAANVPSASCAAKVWPADVTVTAAASPLLPLSVTFGAATIAPSPGSRADTAQPPDARTKLRSARLSLPAASRATTERT